MKNETEIYTGIKSFIEEEKNRFNFDYSMRNFTNEEVEYVTDITHKIHLLMNKYIEMTNVNNQKKVQDNNNILDMENNVNNFDGMKNIKDIVEKSRKILFFLQSNILLNYYRKNRISNSYYLDSYLELNELFKTERIETDSILYYSFQKKIDKIKFDSSYKQIII